MCPTTFLSAPEISDNFQAVVCAYDAHDKSAKRLIKSLFTEVLDIAAIVTHNYNGCQLTGKYTHITELQ